MQYLGCNKADAGAMPGMQCLGCNVLHATPRALARHDVSCSTWHALHGKRVMQHIAWCSMTRQDALAPLWFPRLHYRLLTLCPAAY